MAKGRSGGLKEGRSARRRIARTARLFALSIVLALLLSGTAAADSSITVSAHKYSSPSTALDKFTYIVNEDNTGIPGDLDQLKWPSIAPTESNSPIVAEGDQDSPGQVLPDGRYLISIRSPGHKMWGRHITLPDDAGSVNIGLRETPLPLGKIRVVVFHDNHWANNALDEGEGGLAGFHVTIEEQTEGQVTTDYNGDPLCGGDCVTDADGSVVIDNLGPATYFVYATPPDGQGCGPGGTGTWVQDSTFDGGFAVQAGVEEGSDGSGAPGEGLWEPPDVRTGYWFGFVCNPTDFAQPGTGRVQGTALNWKSYPPFDDLVLDSTEPVRNAYVALSDSTTDDLVYVGQADGDGHFDITGVPQGTYTLSIWDEQLSYIIRFLPVSVATGQQVDLGEVGVSRWFGWLSGEVFDDENKNGERDPGEQLIANTDLDQRWRDGSIKDETFTDENGYYEYAQAEGGPLGKWFIGEQGFAQHGALPGAFVHDPFDPSIVQHVPTQLGGALLTNQLMVEGHRAIVDWGKQSYADNEPGQIVGVTYLGTTRNEFDARFQAHENYEPGIPDVTVLLEAPGPDGQAGTGDDVVVNEYSTDHWSQPGPGNGQSCDVRGANGLPITDLNPLIGPRCLEVPTNGTETKDGGFDGGYAFADYCPQGFDANAPDPDAAPCHDGSGGHEDLSPLVAGTYVTHVVMPKDATGRDLYHIVREEDVNVDLGNEFVPQITPPDCIGQLHEVVIDPDVMPRGSPYEGQMRPLCDKRKIVLKNRQNANADFFLMTNFKNGLDVQPPGRIVGLVTDDIYFDRDKQSIWYGEAKPIGNVPIGIRDHAWRLIKTVKTDENGSYEALLPSTETFNCPIPQGPCPGMYVVVVNDPGDEDNPNANFNPNYLTAALAWDVWPGLTTQLDTPLDPISGTGCELATDVPELLEVSRPFVRASATGTGVVPPLNSTPASRRIVIKGDSFGTSGTVTLTDPRGILQSRTLGPAINPSPTLAAGGIVRWTNREIEIQVPATGLLFLPGQRQLTITRSNGLTTPNGITLHVLGTVGTSAYNPNVVQVGPPTSAHAIQTAIDGSAADSLLVLQPGVYHENVIMHKRQKLQGLGPGGIIGAQELLQRTPEDPRQNIAGTVIDGRFFPGDRAAWRQAISNLGPFAGVDADHPVLEGADITVLAHEPGSFNNVDANRFNAARIDAVGLMTGTGQGGGGIQAQAYARNLQITNDVLQSNGGLFAGGIGLGQPYFDSHNTNVRMAFDRIMGNGGLMRSGGVGIFRGSDNYELANSIVCSNYGVEYGAGVSHWGLSPNGSIHDNQIYYNDSFDSGGGLTISQETPQPLPDGTQVLGDSSGPVNVDRNLIQGNFSGDDGGGIFIQNAMTARINLRNNMIVNNGAADLGGAITLDDSSNVAIVNNTIARNVSTASSENSDTTPHSAGLASEANSTLFQATLPAGAPRFSRPVALFNDIFFQNQAFTLSQPGPGATLVSQGFMDFEVHGAPGSFQPRYSMVTTGPAGQGNIVGAANPFVAPFTLELTVAGSRLDPQMAAVRITNQDPPVGVPGNYHLTAAAAAVDRGVRCSNTPFPGPTLAACSASAVAAPSGLNADYDGQYRPQLRTLRSSTPWDMGADELPGVPVILP